MPRFLNAEERDRISDAIRRAEEGSAGEVRVHLEKNCKGDALERARALFESMCMGDTRGDTGVLLYVATASHKAAVWAGAGVHAGAADGFWEDVIGKVSAGYREGAGADGLVAAIDEIGELLREHMPGADKAGNELPDEVSTS